jgi:type II secretory pathway pseudopilin PulG
MNVRTPQTATMLRSGRGATIPVAMPRTLLSSDRRAAFTLLEVVLALSLAVILLGAIFTAMDQSWKMTASGREEMERSQLARALMRKFAIDIRSIAYAPPPVTDSDSTSSSTGSSSGTSSSSSGSSGSSTASTASTGSSSSSSSGSTSSTTGSSSTTPSDEPSARSIGIRGNSQQIEMHISRARRDLEFSANLDGAKMQSHTSDLRVVTYQLAMAGVSMPNGAMMQGLVRTEGDRMATQLVEEKGSAPTSLSLPQALAPEVASVQFRFFDGVSWFTVWDSEEAGRLPRAVEVVITFAPSQAKLGPALRTNVSQSTNTFRSVVLIPISEPLPAEFTP